MTKIRAILQTCTRTLLFLFLLLPAVSYVEELPQFQSLQELNKSDKPIGLVSAYVVKIYRCPPCPKGSFCKPCMLPNIIISDSNQELLTYKLNDTNLVLYTGYSDEFVIGKKYQFEIDLADRKRARLLNYKNITTSLN